MLRPASLLVLLFLELSGTPSLAAAPSSISGTVVDANTGLPLANVLVRTVGPSVDNTHTDVRGRFSFTGLIAGPYQLTMELAGYQTTLSEQVIVGAGELKMVTLSMSRQAVGGTTMRTIGRTVVTASGSLQRSAIIVKQQSIETLERAGIFRTGDFLRTMPQVNLNASTGGTDTPSPGDDIYLDIRGIGGLETVALLNNHPIGLGIVRGRNVGYNWEVSPTFALRNIEVTFGSGVPGLTPYSAIGGVADMHMLEPTPTNEMSFTQGWGTYSKLVTSFTATGTWGQVGYALALGTQGLDGPYKNQFFFQPAAAFDPSAPAGTIEHDSGVYRDDSTVINRGEYAKFRLPIGNGANPQTLGHLSLSALAAYYWDDKTGNGDQDFLPFDTALATGNSLLSAYQGLMPPGPCTISNPGSFGPTNANGAPWGTGINGMPDGGTPCVTPTQYANTISGLQGAGPTFQTFTISDYEMRYDQPVGRTNLTAEFFTNRFFQLYDRTFQEPFFATFGDNPFYLNLQVNTTGESISDQWTGNDNDIGLGFATNNYAYLFSTTGVGNPSPIVSDQTMYLQDVYHPGNSHYRVYFNLADTYASVTKTTVVNPRLAFIDELSPHDTLRLAGGEASTQPYASYVDLPFSATAIGALASFLNCTGLTSIGQVANPFLQPERANDQEFSFGHGFSGDSQLQLTLYSENINSKIYATLIPVSTLPPGVIPQSTINAFETAINAACGTSGLSGVGVNVQANVGRLLARGIDLSGRARVSRKLFFDFDYSLESTALRSADATTLQNNLTLIVGSQLPGVPLHKAQAAIDATFGRNVDVRLTQYWVSANNSKNSANYNYGDLSVSVPLGSASTVNMAVGNVFNQFTGYNGQIGHGLPAPLNQYATAANYTPLIGTAATELFGLPNRQFFVSYTYHVH